MVITRLAALMSTIFLVSACGYHIGAAQTREGFIEQTKGGGVLSRDEKFLVNRPIKSVVADLREYADKCLNKSVTTGPNYMIKEVGGTMHYHAKLDTPKPDYAIFSFQAEQGRVSARHGAPPGGIFHLVAQMHMADANSTRITLNHYIAVNSVAEQFKRWVNGDKGQCPKL